MYDDILENVLKGRCYPQTAQWCGKAFTAEIEGPQGEMGVHYRQQVQTSMQSDEWKT